MNGTGAAMILSSSISRYATLRAGLCLALTAGLFTADLFATQPPPDARTHWAFQAPRVVAPPVVKNTRWPRTNVDRFILATLEAHGLAPAPRADRRTLIRRAAFDLLGLPPSPEEVQAFIADPASDGEAFARLVD